MARVYFLVICLKRLKEPILEILYGTKTVFTRSAITPLKMNQSGWNLEQCEPNLGLALADHGHDPRSSDSLRGVFFPKKRKNCSQNFQVLRLQTVITTRWLQIAGNSFSIDPSTGCLVSIITVRIDSKSFLRNVRFVQERYLRRYSQRPMFDIAHKPIVRRSADAA